MKFDVSGRKRLHALPDGFRLAATTKPGAVLLETAKFDDENYRSLLFTDPQRELIANTPDEIGDVLDQIDRETKKGRYVAGFLSYECGELFHGLSNRKKSLQAVPLIRMGVFESRTTFDHGRGIFTGTVKPANMKSEEASSGPAEILTGILGIPERGYAAKIERVQDYLMAGHSYQVNFTDRVHGTFRGLPGELYALLIAQQPVSYAAYLDYGDYQVISLSPELFYRTLGERLVMKPMKGTWPRGLTVEGDSLAAEALFNDPKNRAEHTTIVDLLRNDLGKVCRFGSVQVEKFMQVERYRSLFQMTSTITGVRDSRHSSTQIFRALFPSGSITGAPKRRTMEIIQELESDNRGIYTGAIGWFGPNGQACFNVAIRTLLVHGDRYTLGVGGGITVDSTAAAEYEECKLKASFLQRPAPDFVLIETMRAVSGRIPLFERHLLRLSGSAKYFQIPLDKEALRREVFEVLREAQEGERRVRLTVDKNGRATIECTSLNPVPWSGNLIVSSVRTNPSDIFLYHKTSHRQLYENAFADARRRGFDEVLFLNRDGFLTEGSISNIFLQAGDRTLTPPIEHGLLPGVQRAWNLENAPQSRETGIRLTDFQTADRVWVCNALRGNRTVAAISDESGGLLWKSPSFGSIQTCGLHEAPQTV